MKIIPLSASERAHTGFTHKINITFADIAAGALTNTIAVMPDSGSFPAGTLMSRTAVKVKTAFTGGGVTALTMSVGDSGSSTRFINAQSIFTATYGVANTMNVYSAADYVRALFTATTANLNLLTAGELDLYVHVQNLNDLNNN